MMRIEKMRTEEIKARTSKCGKRENIGEAKKTEMIRTEKARITCSNESVEDGSGWTREDYGYSP